jgi:hypothetical protein
MQRPYHRRSLPSKILPQLITLPSEAHVAIPRLAGSPVNVAHYGDVKRRGFGGICLERELVGR